MSRLEAIRALFVARPHDWIDGRQLAQVGGYAAWRTRVADCRVKFGMVIENSVERHEDYTVSKYRYHPDRLF